MQEDVCYFGDENTGSFGAPQKKEIILPCDCGTEVIKVLSYKGEQEVYI